MDPLEIKKQAVRQTSLSDSILNIHEECSLVILLHIDNGLFSTFFFFEGKDDLLIWNQKENLFFYYLVLVLT